MESAWTFHRGDERLTLVRRETDEGLDLLVSGAFAPRSYHFREEAALVKFQGDMEEFLLKTGWSLAHFSPERRVQDRRGFPRVDVDRRRWWTDGWRLFQNSRLAHRRNKRRTSEQSGK